MNRAVYPIICVIGVLEGKELEDRAGEIFHEIMTESFSNLVKDLVGYRFGKHCEPQAKNKYREKPHLNIIRLPKW